MLGIMVDMLPAAVTAGDLPLELEALQAFALEQNRLACVLWEQLESLQHQIAQLNAHASARALSAWRVRPSCLTPP